MRDGRISLLFGGDERQFRLGIDELLALEDKLDAGVAEIGTRLSAGKWRVRDVQHVIRLGLIGGGMEPKPAQRLVDEQVTGGKLVRAALVARVVIGAALAGDDSEDDAPGKAADATEAPEANASPPASFTEPAQSLDSPRPKLDA